MSRCARLLLVFILTAATVHAADDWGPWDAPDRLPPPRILPADSGIAPLKAGVRFFQRFISPVDGPRCPMSPTCSAYALQALDKHGPLLGVMMTVDRLLHETDPREHRHPLAAGDRLRYADPLENNDFWFTDR